MNAKLTLACLLAALVCSALPATAGQVLDRIMERGYMLLMGEPAWPPFSFKDESGNYAGFDVEVADEIARRLGVEPRRIERAMNWEQETGGNWDGIIDVSIGSMTPTNERARNLVFPAIYYYAPASLAVNASDTLTSAPADTGGKRFGVLAASTYLRYLRREPFGIEDETPVEYPIDDPVIVTYDIEGAAIDDLRKGAVDATIDYLPTLLDAIHRGAQIRIVGQPLFYLPQAVALEKGDPELADKLASIVADMRRDGTLTRISMKWFGVDLTVIP